LGIPGSSVAALFMAALIMHGIQPGPRFFESGGGALPYTVFAGILLAQFMFLALGLLLLRLFVKVVSLPNKLLVPIIVILCFIGAFTARSNMLDVFYCIVFGIMGYLFTINKWPKPCLILGLVLGRITEANFHRFQIIGDGSFLPLITRPIALLFILCAIFVLCWSYISEWLQRMIKEWKNKNLSNG
jgi:putative tricarboxylic transport membrane protein